MYIAKVLSYKGAWDLANDKYNTQIDELYRLIAQFIETNEKPMPAYKASRHFDSLLRINGWQELKRLHLGLIKDGVSADFTLANSAFLNRWIFHHSVVALRREVVELPILILPCKDNTMFERMLGLYSIEYFERQLIEISPLSHQHRFLVLGFTNEMRDILPDVVELESDPLVNEANQIINRSIEFPPEYHQAGIGILNFFGTYLREQYPNEEAKVKIIQEGLKVRMVIETLDGESETIEKALHEYQLIVSGQAAPEKFTTNDKLLIELKNELRFAKLRVETQQDLIGIQNNRIDQLLQIVETGLSNKQPISIDFKPTISLSNTVQFNPDISFALGSINELRDSLPASSEAHVTLKELEGSLEAVEKEKDPQVVRKSSAMSKFKRFIDKVTEGNNEVGKAIKAVENGWDIFQDLAGRYNSIAQWCGLPQVPTIFTKK